MMNLKVKHLFILLVTFLVLSTANAFGAEAKVSVSYLYNLSNFSGILHVSWVDIAVNATQDEIYVLTGRAIKIFNDKGMEVYSFNDAGEIPVVLDVAVDDEGNIIALTNSNEGIVRCNYRGEPVEKMELQNLPPQFAGFAPGRILYRKGLFYFASLQSKQVVITDAEGRFKDGYNIGALINLDEYVKENVKKEDTEDTDIVGFNVDQEGNILFTLPIIAKAFVLSPDKTIKSFGTLGGAEGKFGVPGGITADASGKFILVADTLRCVVLVFDRTFKFYGEFGHRGYGPGNLIGPMQLAVDGQNRVYVTQLANRGVSVYQLTIS
ncbi:MAG TPA: hypothetical protein VL122_01775 [Nitrospirota bacterium]|nr:hypothetical protein [Nitrospirota bacterium]